MSKTTDYSVRLVLSAANINVDKKEDLMVDMNYSGIPLSAACVIAYPFMIYQLRQFFNNEFGGRLNYSYIDKSGQLQQTELDNPQIAFSDDRFDKELNEFIHGYSNRFKAVTVPNKDNKNIRLRFKGHSISEEEYKKGEVLDHNMIDRDLTWVDIFYIAAVAATEDKMAMISRYPIKRIVAL